MAISTTVQSICDPIISGCKQGRISNARGVVFRHPISAFVRETSEVGSDEIRRNKQQATDQAYVLRTAGDTRNRRGSCARPATLKQADVLRRVGVLPLQDENLRGVGFQPGSSTRTAVHYRIFVVSLAGKVRTGSGCKGAIPNNAPCKGVRFDVTPCHAALHYETVVVQTDDEIRRRLRSGLGLAGAGGALRRWILSIHKIEAGQGRDIRGQALKFLKMLMWVKPVLVGHAHGLFSLLPNNRQHFHGHFLALLNRIHRLLEHAANGGAQRCHKGQLQLGRGQVVLETLDVFRQVIVWWGGKRPLNAVYKFAVVAPAALLRRFMHSCMQFGRQPERRFDEVFLVDAGSHASIIVPSAMSTIATTMEACHYHDSMPL